MSFYSQFAEYYEAVFPFQEVTYAFLKGWLPAGARRVLDAGCGTGHYCGRFAADGLEAVGIDLDPEMIAVARTHYPAPAFHCLNMLDVGTLAPPFDLVCCIGNSAPHLTQDEFARVVEQMARLLAPDGIWTFQIINWDAVLTSGTYPFRPRKLEPGDATFFREYRDVSESRIRFVTRLTSGARTVFEGDVWLYPMRTAAYLELHARHGFELLGHFADFQGTPYEPLKDGGSVFVFRKR
jgi:SAM-dependent methyltransferase